MAHRACFASHAPLLALRSTHRRVLNVSHSSSVRRRPRGRSLAVANSPAPSSLASVLAGASTTENSSLPLGYEFASIERKWQEIWAKRGDFRTPGPDQLDTSKPKYYALDMFPYPSGAGLHVGHPSGYMATDVMARLRKKQGYNVLHPMGWDAFGLPAEQYALQTGMHPRDTTTANTARFRSQLERLGFSYDWSRELSTVDNAYVKWTQWIFARLFERGLAYQAEVPVNWCPALGTVLANEEVIDGVSERGGHPVVRRPMRQWVLRITAYADRLLEDLEDLDWPQSIKDMQRNWIGRSEGLELDFHVGEHTVTVFTTRAETVSGASYVVVAPEWDGIMDIVTDEQREQVTDYIEKALRKSDRERMDDATKTGVFTGAYATCSITGRSVPVWVANYVLGGYGTGAVMAVPGHDLRDFVFAQTHGLPVYVVVDGGEAGKCHTDAGSVINWPADCGIDLNGLDAREAREKLAAWAVDKCLARKKVNYKLRDWLFSRQRYWGEPFPIIFDKDGTPTLVPDDNLPVLLPEVESYVPSGTGESPLATVSSWVDTPLGRRETNTMPQWAGSCWYYLRFIDPLNSNALVDGDLEKYWMPVDLYVGGVEHAVLHLLYARFWHKVLYDVGVVSTKEPFGRLVNQGMILGEVEYTAWRDEQDVFHSEQANGWSQVRLSADDVVKQGDVYVLRADPAVRVSARAHKMSKSRGNVVNPDAVIATYGADALRCYLMFMAPVEQVKPWQTNGVGGMARFLARAWRLIVDPTTNTTVVTDDAPSDEARRILHATIKRVSEDTEAMRFNTAIAALIEFVNAATKWEQRPRSAMLQFVSMLGIYAPHVAEELWSRLGNTEPLAHAPWPVFDPTALVADQCTIVVQVNGKVRAKIPIASDAVDDREAVLELARQLPQVQKYTAERSVARTIYVPGKLVNLVLAK